VLCDLGQVGHGSSVLVNGASGGVGHLTVQVAKARGALVAATASAARREFVTALGADVFIDYQKEPVSGWPMAFDAVLDCVPNLPRRLHRRLLKRRGHYVTTLPNGWTYTLDPLLNRLGRVRRHAMMLRPNAAAVAELAGYVEQGRLRCEIAGEFPLEEFRRAVELSRSGRVTGKLVIRAG
jgi:NADPH:quinone reductase-like Zn-dependent oxidoreductase